MVQTADVSQVTMRTPLKIA
jgi:hypothetical protein